MEARRRETGVRRQAALQHQIALHTNASIQLDAGASCGSPHQRLLSSLPTRTGGVLPDLAQNSADSFPRLGPSLLLWTATCASQNKTTHAKTAIRACDNSDSCICRRRFVDLDLACAHLPILLVFALAFLLTLCSLLCTAAHTRRWALQKRVQARGMGRGVMERESETERGG
eukprot:3000088-Pleurochrysis_carterae.AAC.1